MTEHGMCAILGEIEAENGGRQMKLEGYTNANPHMISNAILNLARRLKMDRDSMWQIVNGLQPGCASLTDLTPANMLDLLVTLANK